MPLPHRAATASYGEIGRSRRAGGATAGRPYMRAASYSEAVESRQKSRAPERFEVVGKDPHPPTCGRRPLSPAGPSGPSRPTPAPRALRARPRRLRGRGETAASAADELAHPPTCGRRPLSPGPFGSAAPHTCPSPRPRPADRGEGVGECARWLLATWQSDCPVAADVGC